MEWIGCDLCNRWTHSSCEKTHGSLSENAKDSDFQCAECREKIQEEKEKQKLKLKKQPTKDSTAKKRKQKEGVSSS